MEKDQIFNASIQKPEDFRFGTSVANVFDDMVNRSVPYYGEIQRMVAELASTHARPGTKVYDLGCSTGTTMIGMNSLVAPSIKFIGVDDSPEMMDKCRAKLEEARVERSVDLEIADLNKRVSISDASVVVLCLTLQFVRPVNREKLIREVYSGLVEGGVLILVEKILAEGPEFNRDFIRYYYDYKRRKNYSELEIAQKREALENVLVPYRVSENVYLLKECGFGYTEIFFKWYNFCGLIAQKNKA